MEARAFLENFQVTDIEKDPLPIKVLRNAITKEEIFGLAVHWGFEYLDSRSCPFSLIFRILQKLNKEVPQTNFLHCAAENHSGASDDGMGAGSPEPDARYEPLKLMQAIVKKIDEICLREREDVHDSVDGIIEAPDMLPNVHAVSYNNIKNTRRFMEDRMTVLPRMDRVFNLPVPMSYFAVFDGHNGSEAAAYGAAQLHQYLIKSMTDSQDMIDCISNAFENLDEVFVQKCRAGKIKSGSTAVITLLMADKVYVAWAGDSQAVLVKQNEVNNLVNPHKPERLDEVERIRSLGGEVLNLNGTYRVHGNLAVSRAIGDADEKPFIIATPDIKMQELDGSEEFLILACDGLWDEVTPEAAAQIVRRQVVTDPSNLSGVSNKLIQEAKQRGSTDNITVIVVFFQPLESIKNLYESTITVDSGLDNNIMSKFETFGFNPAEKLIENSVDGKISPMKEINGHGKDGEPLVDFLSLESSKESGGQPITDDTDQFGDDDDKDVEQLSDAEPDDEWQFEKPENPAIGTATLDIQLNQTAIEPLNDTFDSTFIQEVSNKPSELVEPEVEIFQKPLPIDETVQGFTQEISDKVSDSLNPFIMETAPPVNGNENGMDGILENASSPSPAPLANGGNLFDGETIVSEISQTELDEDKPIVLSGSLNVFSMDRQQSSPDPFETSDNNLQEIPAQPSAEEIDLGAPSPHFDFQSTYQTNESAVAAGDAGVNPFEDITSASESQMDFTNLNDMQQIPTQSNIEEIGLGDNNTNIQTGIVADFLVGEQQVSDPDPFGIRDNFDQVPPITETGDVDTVFTAPNFDLHNTQSATEAASPNPFAAPPLLDDAGSKMDFNIDDIQQTLPQSNMEDIGLLEDTVEINKPEALADFMGQGKQSPDPFGIQDNFEQIPPLTNAGEIDLIAESSNIDLQNSAPVKESIPDLTTFGDELISTSDSQVKINGGDEHFNLQEEAALLIEKSEVFNDVEAIIEDASPSPQLLAEPDIVASNTSAITSPEPEIEMIQKSLELLEPINSAPRSSELSPEPVDSAPPVLTPEISDKVSDFLNPFTVEAETVANGIHDSYGNEPPILEKEEHLFNGENTLPQIDDLKIEEKSGGQDLLPDFVVDEQKAASGRQSAAEDNQEIVEPPEAIVEEIVVAKSATPDLQAAPVPSAPVAEASLSSLEIVAEAPPASVEEVAKAATPVVEEVVKMNGVGEHIIINNKEVSQVAEKSNKIVRNVETKTATAAKTGKLPAKPDSAAPKARAPVPSTTAARKSPTKPSTTTTQAPSKPTLMNGKSTAAAKPTAPRSTTTAPKPAAGRVPGAPTSTAPKTATNRVAPSSARPLPAKKDGVESKIATSKAPATTLKARPATAPSSAKPAPAKPLTTTSPKRVPPTATSTVRSTTTARPATAAKSTTVGVGAKAGEVDGKTGTAALAKPRPRPLTATTTTTSRVPAKPDGKSAGTERKVGTTGAISKPGTSSTAPRTASRPLASRPVPTTTRTVSKTTTTSTTASKPAPVKSVTKPVTVVTAAAEPLQTNNSTN